MLEQAQPQANLPAGRSPESIGRTSAHQENELHRIEGSANLLASPHTPRQQHQLNLLHCADSFVLIGVFDILHP